MLNAYSSDNSNNYITFQDIHVKDSNGDGVRYYRCDYGNVRRVRVEFCNMSGIRYVQCHRYTPTGDLGGDRLSIIEYCEVSGDNQNYIAHGNQGFAMGSVGGSHVWVHHNIMHEGYGESIGVYNNTSLPDQGWATVEDNIIYDMRKAGIYIASGRDTIVRRNLIYHTGNSTYYLTYANGRYWGGPGLGVCNEIGDNQNYQSNNVYFYDNLVTGCHGGLGISSQWPAGEDAISNIKYFNNTLVANNINTSIGLGGRAAIQAGFGNEIKNNIFWLYDSSVEDYQFRGYAPYSGITWDYNLWSSDPEIGCAYSWHCERVKGANDPYYALPQLTRTSGWHNVSVGEITPDDFTLQSSSPAIDAGIDVGLTYDFAWNTVPYGLGTDIGAFEFTNLDSDINDDGKVNLEDFAVLATWWDNKNACALSDWCGGADFDMSGTINFFDLAYFVENW
ncbi:MAG: right-handed parallel beta-helix repeat-containing protein, partial [Sedimentisphaerales bacterium]|nr:right-handed parallel beta-helix repeat-containing protein [Sedimentisphaerales bacterium]